jgi:2-polyprenyl-6-methoxyphenol hydroxylase-like FAD-dependent oxidoreductase
MGGLAAARVLADHFDTVTVLDRDHATDQPPSQAHRDRVDPRKGVPQGRHAHALLAGGARAIEQLFPGIMEEMVAAGAARLDFNAGTWFQAGGRRARLLAERPVIGASRPFIEAHLRRRAAALPNVRLVAGITVTGLVHRAGRVVGVNVVEDGLARVIDADLVVDCSGRASSAPQWLQAAGYRVPEVDEVRCDMRYATMILRRRPDDIEGRTFAVIIESPPHGKRAGFVLPAEGDRWIVTIASSFGAEPPHDEASFRELAATLPSPELHELLTRADPLTPIASHRLASSRRRRYEKLKRVPAGFIVLGDAICSFNPVYGQGMSSAVMQAVDLGACLREHENDEALVRATYRRAAKVIDTPWKIAVGADFAYPECTGPKPAGTDLMNRYLARVLLAAQVSDEVNTALIMVQNLIASPTSLMRPALVRTVLRAAREAELRQAATASSERSARAAA